MKTNLLKLIALLFVLIYALPGQGQNNDNTSLGNGIRTISVSTLSGEVVDVKVPADIRPGDHITASVSGSTSSAELSGAVIDVQNKKTDLSKKLFSFIVPAAGLTALSFAIIDKTGKSLCKTDLNVNSHVPENNSFTSLPTSNTTTTVSAVNGNFVAPSICTPGSPMIVRGVFDGDAANTQVQINKISCDVISESPRGAFVSVPPNAENGPGTVKIVENGISKTYPIQVASINMTSDKPVINKGQNAKINVTVSGLDQMVLDGKGYGISLNNMSPQSVSFAKTNGNTITKELNSAVVNNGVYNFSTDIKGITSGKYTLTATLNSDWDNYREKCGLQYLDALDAGVPPSTAEQYLDFVLAAYHPGTAPGGCPIGPAKSGGSLNCNVGNCTGICIIFSLPKKGPGDPKEEGPSATPAPGRIYFCSCSKWQWW